MILWVIVMVKEYLSGNTGFHSPCIFSLIPRKVYNWLRKLHFPVTNHVLILQLSFLHFNRAGKRTVRRPKFISPSSQLVICFALVGVQVLIGAIWIVMSPPKAGPYYPTRWDNQLVCISAVGTEYMIGFAYPILLIVICTVYAILTRKIPEAFNESKYIGFTMYTTCIIWLAFVPIYFSTANNIEIRLATMCFSISLSGTVSLACLFTPKLYIILIHPERNVRQSMMSSKLVASNKTPNSSSLRVDSGTQSDGKFLYFFSSILSQNTSIVWFKVYFPFFMFSWERVMAPDLGGTLNAS